MTALRAFAIGTLGLLAGYHALRIIAGQCSGAQCDWFIPVSLLLPLLILLVDAVTGVLAIATAGPPADRVADPLYHCDRVGPPGPTREPGCVSR
jgi:hypothetical protein